MFYRGSISLQSLYNIFSVFCCYPHPPELPPVSRPCMWWCATLAWRSPAIHSRVGAAWGLYIQSIFWSKVFWIQAGIEPGIFWSRVARSTIWATRLRLIFLFDSHNLVTSFFIPNVKSCQNLHCTLLNFFVEKNPLCIKIQLDSFSILLIVLQKCIM